MNQNITIFLQNYRDDGKYCEKLYSNPEMFFDIWKEDFINRMEEERKKRKAEQKLRRQNRKKNEQSNQRTEKKVQAIIPTWVGI